MSSKRKNKPKKNRCKLWKGLAIFSAIGTIYMFIDGHPGASIFYLILMIVFIGAYKNSKEKELLENQQNKKAHKTVSPKKKVSAPEISSITKALEDNIPDVPNIPDIPIQQPANDISEPAPVSEITERHHVTGIAHYMSGLMELASENYEYTYTKKELIDNFLEDERIYQYEFNIEKVELIEEPTNPYDSNAVKVVLDDVHVGYIKKGSCSHIKKLLSSGRILDISAEIGGGKYKYLSCEYDYERGKDIYELERSERSYFVNLILHLKENN